jgi:hypothetical protein
MNRVKNRRKLGWGIAAGLVLGIAGGAGGESDRGASAVKNSAPPESDRPLAQARTSGPAKERIRVREGLELNDRIGIFELSGDRARFIASDDGLALIGLENLSLERVIHAIRDNPQPGQTWKVSGVVTEFEGRNYLLITRAILASRPQ